MDDAMFVQAMDGGGQSGEPLCGEFGGDAVGMPGQDGRERLAGDVLHDEPVVAILVGTYVVKVDEVWVLEVEALRHAAHLDVEVLGMNPLERDFLAAVGDGEIDLAEAAKPDAALERVAGQGMLSGMVGEFHHWVAPDFLPSPHGGEGSGGRGRGARHTHGHSAPSPPAPLPRWGEGCTIRFAPASSIFARWSAL